MYLQLVVDYYIKGEDKSPGRNVDVPVVPRPKTLLNRYIGIKIIPLLHASGKKINLFFIKSLNKRTNTIILKNKISNNISNNVFFYIHNKKKYKAQNCTLKNRCSNLNFESHTHTCIWPYYSRLSHLRARRGAPIYSHSYLHASHNTYVNTSRVQWLYTILFFF